MSDGGLGVIGPGEFGKSNAGGPGSLDSGLGTEPLIGLGGLWSGKTGGERLSNGDGGDVVIPAGVGMVVGGLTQ